MIRSALGVLVVTMPLAGQLSVSARTQTQIDAKTVHYTRSGPPTTIQKSIPANTVLRSPVSHSGGSPPTQIALSWTAGREFHWKSRFRAYGSNDGYGNQTVGMAAGTVSFTLRSVAPVRGRLTVTNVQIQGGTAAFAELKSSGFSSFGQWGYGSRSKVVTLGPLGLKVDYKFVLMRFLPRVQANWANAETRISFVPETRFDSYGTGCGPLLAGALATNRVVFDASKLPGPNGTSMLLFGVDEIKVQIPNTSCLVLTTPLLGVPLTNTAQGTARVSFAKPAGIYNLRAQVWAFHALRREPYLSNGLHVWLY